MANLTLPSAPLLDRARQCGFETDVDMADVFGISHQSVGDWGDSFRVRSGADLQRLDRYACALGSHPFDLWPDWFDISLIVPMVGGEKCNPPCPVMAAAAA